MTSYGILRRKSGEGDYLLVQRPRAGIEIDDWLMLISAAGVKPESLARL